MTSNSSGKSPKTAAGNTTPPTARRSERQQGTTRPNRNQNRAVARAGTPGSAQSGLSPLAGWTIAFVAVAAVVIGAALLLSVMSQSGSSGIKTPSVLTPTNIAFSGRTLGKEDAPVTVLLYGDFRCSACANFTEGGTELNLVTNYVATGRAKLVWHDRLIIDELRQDGTASRDAANAAMCAADQNKFWPMHDWLYANQSTTEDASAFTPARLSDIGKAAGLDMTRLQPCMDAGTHNAEISAANLVARKTVNGTPTVYVNGKVAGDPTQVATYDQIKAAIDAEPATAPSAAPATAAPSPMPSPTPAVTPAPSAQPSTKPS